MSTTIPPVPPTTTRDNIIAASNSLPELIQRASMLDPPLAAALTGQAKTASATPLGALIGAGLAWVAAHYGLDWGASFDNLAAGLAIVGGGYLTHWWQARHSGLAPAPTVAPVVVVTAAPTVPPTPPAA